MRCTFVRPFSGTDEKCRRGSDGITDIKVMVFCFSKRDCSNEGIPGVSASEGPLRRVLYGVEPRVEAGEVLFQGSMNIEGSLKKVRPTTLGPTAHYSQAEGLSELLVSAEEL